MKVNTQASTNRTGWNPVLRLISTPNPRKMGKCRGRAYEIFPTPVSGRVSKKRARREPGVRRWMIKIPAARAVNVLKK